MLKTWLKRISIVLLITIAILMIWDIVAPPDSEDCSICGHLKFHAPCILNLATGEIGELELYQPHFQKVGEIAEEQTGGTFSFIYPAGLKGIRLTDPWYIEVDVPMEGERKNNALYCRKCRSILTEYTQGYILLDLYNKEMPVVYNIGRDEILEFRCYRISVIDSKEREMFCLRVDGTLE